MAFEIQNAKVYKQTNSLEDTVLISGNFNLKTTKVKLNKHSDLLLSAESVLLNAKQFALSKSGLKVSLPFKVSSQNLRIGKADKKLSADLNISTNNGQIDYLKDSATLNVKNIELNYDDKHFIKRSDEPVAWDKLLAKTSLKRAEISYQSKSANLEAKDLKWNPQSKSLSIADFAYKPEFSLAETKLKKPYQSDYITGSAKSITVNDINLTELKLKKTLEIKSVLIDSAKLNVSRDKRMAEKNIAEKLMPSKLLAGIKSEFSIGEVKLCNSDVYIHETSIATGLEGTIPLNNINVGVYKLTNRFKEKDSIEVSGTALLMNANKIALNYRESYADSLSGFKMNMQIQPIDLT
ncbi:MAG: hypothetical protein EOP00_27340, partial [Pedobacter sp.]